MNKKFFKLMLAMVLCVCSASVRAESANQLVLSLNDGSRQTFMLSESPVISHAGGNLEISCGADVINAPLASVLNYSFSSVSTGINAVEENKPVYKYGHVYISGARAAAEIGVYSIDGTKVCATATDSDGNADIDLNQLQSGAYIIKSPASSIKIIKK